jgi:SPP1 family predicted phage head-tail adaptor
LVRNIFYEDLGITSTEKYLAVQAKTDVVKRIRIRYDSKITQKGNRVRVDGTDYKITRIYADKDNGYEELSLDYVD